MLASYDFLAPGRILFGWDRRLEVGSHAAPLGQRAFLVWGSRALRGRAEGRQIVDSLLNAGLELADEALATREPLVEDVDQLADHWHHLGAARGGVVVAVGGGAALDLAKAAAALAVNRLGSSALDYLEGVGRGLEIHTAPLPLVALPTTAGTGSEATKNAVLSVTDPPAKKSLRSERLLARAVIVDPALTVSCPRHVTVHSGLDAITQLIESYVSRRSKPIPRALAAEGLRGAIPALPRAVEEPADRTAREAMAHAALLSGLALANSGLGLAHGVAAALGSLEGVPHGLACAVMLPWALRANREACFPQLTELADAVGLEAPRGTAADRFIARIEQLCLELQVPVRLRELGLPRERVARLAPAAKGNSLDGNPRPLAEAELIELLEAAW
jgi:alcohol dehydrogenase class IV